MSKGLTEDERQTIASLLRDVVRLYREELDREDREAPQSPEGPPPVEPDVGGAG